MRSRNLDRGLAATLLAILAIACGIVARTVESEGVGLSRDGAVQGALRNAVEQCAGISIDSKTFIENQMTISDKILTHAAGYVSNFSVLAENAEFGLVMVRVSADVSMGKLEKDLSAQKLLYELENKPRIMVVLDERMDDRDMREKTATHKFEEFLLSRGFIVIEPEQFEKIRQTENDRDLASLAFREGADLIIRGNVTVGAPAPIMVYGTQFFAVPAQINAHIVRTDNAQIIASKTKRIRKNSRDAQSAAQFGLECGGTELAQELVEELNRFWQSEAYNENRTELIITGCSEKDLIPIEQAIRHMPFTRDLRLRFLEGSSALYDLDMRGTIQEVRAGVRGKAEE